MYEACNYGHYGHLLKYMYKYAHLCVPIVPGHSLPIVPIVVV
jgi:hypothetical protein